MRTMWPTYFRLSLTNYWIHIANSLPHNADKYTLVFPANQQNVRLMHIPMLDVCFDFLHYIFVLSSHGPIMFLRTNGQMVFWVFYVTIT